MHGEDWLSACTSTWLYLRSSSKATCTRNFRSWVQLARGVLIEGEIQYVLLLYRLLEENTERSFRSLSSTANLHTVI